MLVPVTHSHFAILSCRHFFSWYVVLLASRNIAVNLNRVRAAVDGFYGQVHVRKGNRLAHVVVREDRGEEADGQLHFAAHAHDKVGPGRRVALRRLIGKVGARVVPHPVVHLAVDPDVALPALNTLSRAPRPAVSRSLYL